MILGGALWVLLDELKLWFFANDDFLWEIFIYMYELVSDGAEGALHALRSD